MNFFIPFLSGVLLISCNSKRSTDYMAMTEDWSPSKNKITQDHPGKQLMENHCYVCHNPKAKQESMIAPPMVSVRMHYLFEGMTKEDFIRQIVSFIKNPSKENSKMPGAVQKFGLMPYQFYTENTLKQIADYMFEYEMEEPEWLKDYSEERPDNSPKLKGEGQGKKQNGKG